MARRKVEAILQVRFGLYYFTLLGVLIIKYEHANKI
jgi:hypothetical protein